MDTTIFHEFGLTKNETDIFLTLIHKGTLSATEIAKKTGLNRPYVYYAVERLLEKGYISQITEKGKKKFRAMSFRHILQAEEQKVELLKTLAEDLERQREEEKGEISVEVLKGRFVIKNIFRKILSEICKGDELLIIGVDEEKMETIEPVYLKKILNYFKMNNITERVIITKGVKTLEYAKTTKYKCMDKSLIGNTAVFIYQDTVIKIVYGDPIYAVIIKNAQCADTEKKQFELFWKNAVP